MRNILCLAAAAAIATTVMVGCAGNGSDPAPGNLTARVLAGFVYAKGNALGAGPEIVVTASANPPTGYFAPTAGTVTLAVADGTLTRAPDNEPFNMAVSNAIVVTAVAQENTTVAVSGSGLQLNGNGKVLTAYNVNLGAQAATGTVLTIQSPTAPSYTPGTPVALQYTINGNAPTSPTEDFIAGAPIGSGGPRTLSIVALDSNGVINPAATFTVSSSTNGVTVSGSGASRTLTPGTAANSAVEGNTTISVELDGQNVIGTFLADFSYGTETTVAVVLGDTLLLWNTVGAEATTSVDVNVKNQFGANMFDRAVTLTNPAKVAANVWITQAGATAFTNDTGNTDTGGNFSTTLTAPVSAVAGGGLDLTPKGTNTITATVGAAIGTDTIKVIRPLDSVTIVGPTRVDVGTTTPSTGATSYRPIAAVDVDGASAPLTDYPALTLTYTVTNGAGAPPFGNTGDLSVPTVATAAIMAGAGNENRVVAGLTAGQYSVQVTGGVPTPSNIVATDVFGDPTKIFLNPDTNTNNVIVGALGNYSGGTGTQVGATFTLLDSAGHTIPSGELSFTSTFTLQGLTGGNVTSGGSNVSAFTLTFGPNDGLLTIALNGGIWNGLSGSANRPFNISKDIGHDND